MTLALFTPKEVATAIGRRLQARRLDRGWTQAELAARAGVALPTLKVAERVGQVSLPRLIRLVMALGYLGDLEQFLGAHAPQSLEELERPKRRRGHINTTTRAVGQARKAP